MIVIGRREKTSDQTINARLLSSTGLSQGRTSVKQSLLAVFIGCAGGWGVGWYVKDNAKSIFLLGEWGLKLKK